jgi:uncharacterized protein (DUF58 family)
VPAAVRTALSGLTVRGRCFLAAGTGCAGCGLILAERDLVRIGVLLAALPLIALTLVSRTRFRLACTRRLEPARVPVGEPVTVALHLANVSRLPTGTLLLEDRLPPALGAAPRFVLDQVEPRGDRDTGYPLTPIRRGRYAVGPLTVWLADPFGVCELPRSFASVDDLVVTPTVWALPDVRLGGEWTGGGHASARSVASAGEDDAAVREYRQGDDLRKVHWRSTAHRGQMMVRREEQPWQSRAVILLDTRGRAHRGSGVDSSFEWAVSAAASIGAQLARAGYSVRLIEDTGEGLPTGGAAGGEPLLLDRLAEIGPTSGTSLRPALAQLRRSGEGLIVAVLGAVDAADVQELARLRHGATSCVAVLLDVAGWGAGGRGRRFDAGYDDAARLLSSAGWRVVPGRLDQPLAASWPQAGAGTPRPLPPQPVGRPA